MSKPTATVKVQAKHHHTTLTDDNFYCAQIMKEQDPNGIYYRNGIHVWLSFHFPKEAGCQAGWQAGWQADREAHREVYVQIPLSLVGCSSLQTIDLTINIIFLLIKYGLFLNARNE